MQAEPRPFSPREWMTTSSMGAKLTLLNVLVFVLWQFPSLRPFLLENFTVSWDGLRSGHVWTAISASFSHSDLLHLFFNMLALHIVSRDLETIYGGKNYLTLYLFGALFTAIGHAGLTLAWHTPWTPALGASGAVMALLVVGALFFPQRRISILFLPVSIPLWVLVCAYVVIDMFGALGNQVVLDGHPVAHGGHLGGAVAGAVWKLLDLRPFSAPGSYGARAPSLMERLRGAARKASRPRLRVLPPLPPEPAVPDATDKVDTATAERVDDLLRKINREGIQALSDEERAFLEKASLRYRK